ncbi:hypothetical protein [Alkalicoccobacillus porphyridii]|uniref:hypothetical protein n=1 Tax=Alkalicoccobacillus porphyridii TaxID=2597270 RepID=UPI00163D62E3|nr:hypothetical protein [Alkalicoccobacillus porphyridii]
MVALEQAVGILFFIMVIALMFAIVRFIVTRYLADFYEGIYQKSTNLYRRFFKNSNG